MPNLLEVYQKRLEMANKAYAAKHQGENLSESKKIMIAKCLENTNMLLTEAFSSNIGTQRADMGMYKKFCMNLLTVALPTLIAPDLVLTQPMSSMSGYITYIEYVTGTAKGDTAEDTVLNDPFKLGDAQPDYTSSRVSIAEIKPTEASGTLKWLPVWKGSVEFIVDGTTTIVDGGDGTLYSGRKVKKEIQSNGNIVETVIDAGTTAGTIDYDKGTYVLTTAPTTSLAVNYCYDNIVVPQGQLPTLKARLRSKALVARARRIAIFYSQLAAFQAKTDYNLDLGAQLAEKAVGELQYEIDTEVVNLLTDNADIDPDLRWNKARPVGVNISDHYESFSEIVSVANQKIYDRTKRFAPNFMIIASNVLPVLTFLKGFTAASKSNINGPYFAGTLDGIKVYVSPAIQPGKFVFGVNGSDMMSSAAIYAPYMPVVPTQLLGFADGGNSQGFATMYDLQLLNKHLLIGGEIYVDDQEVVMKVKS